MFTFIISILFIYRKRQAEFKNDISRIKLDNEKAILTAQLEIQEQTFNHISREIHDNINLSLTLAKLNLNTIELKNATLPIQKLTNSIDLIGQAINDLTVISKGLNADTIIEQGLLRAIEFEVTQIQQADIFEIKYQVRGNPFYMESQKELIIFRIIQEALNNVIKHSKAKIAELIVHFHEDYLEINIKDDGNGFSLDQKSNGGAGLKNMEKRARLLNGEMKFSTSLNNGTIILVKIPIEENERR
jgi:two-component system NarL family sensor kinase